MKKTILLLSAIFTLAIFGGCDNGFEGVNESPNEPVVVPSNLLLPRILTVWGDRSYSSFVGMDMGWDWIQHGAKVQYNDDGRYIIRQSSTESYWDNIYLNVVSESNQMYELAVSEENEAMQGVALTLKAFGFAQLTDLYGDIPFTEALNPEDITPAYDSQQTVYNGSVEILAKADSLLAIGNGTINSDSDLVYGGNIDSWRKFANSLKFRILMRTSLKQDVSSELQQLVNSGWLFNSNEEEAKFAYLSEQPNANPIYESIVFGVREEYRMGEELIENLKSLGDPRLSVYAEPNDAGEYRGKPAGISVVPNVDYNYNNVSGIGELYLDPTLPAMLLSYSELSFLMAEAAERGLISGSAETYYNNAITANMSANGIDNGVDAYINQNSVKLSSASNKLERIAVQKWIALFGQGIEAFTEWRRTPYPALTPAIDGAFNEIPSRYTYPASEQSINAENYQSVISSQGPDQLTTKLWFMP